MNFQKNVHFSILVRIEGRFKEFNFRKRSEDIYDADTSDEQGQRWLFIWKQQDGAWNVAEKQPSVERLPSWLINNVPAIRESFLSQTH